MTFFVGKDYANRDCHPGQSLIAVGLERIKLLQLLEVRFLDSKVAESRRLALIHLNKFDNYIGNA